MVKDSKLKILSNFEALSVISFSTTCLRSKSLAFHIVHPCSINSDAAETGEDQRPDDIFSNTMGKSHSENQEALAAEWKMTDPVPASSVVDKGLKDAERDLNREKGGEEEAEKQPDRLFTHLRDNMETIREFCKGMMQQIPTPDHCVIEGNAWGCCFVQQSID